jgi:hypothetical protein
MEMLETLDQYRRQKDHFFKYDPHSPLLPEQQEQFTGLSYYPENPTLDLQLPVEKLEVQDEVAMQTSTGDLAQFIRWGKIRFEVGGEEAGLTIYAAVHGGGFFLPFMDATSGEETYSGGRYLEIDPLPDGTFIVDFNMAYNPYCAYNELWSCPIPPKENRLKVRIEAGEMKFHE